MKVHKIAFEYLKNLKKNCLKIQRLNDFQMLLL